MAPFRQALISLATNLWYFLWTTVTAKFKFMRLVSEFSGQLLPILANLRTYRMHPAKIYRAGLNEDCTPSDFHLNFM